MTPATLHKLEKAFRKIGVWVSPEGYEIWLQYLASQGVQIIEGEKE